MPSSVTTGTVLRIRTQARPSPQQSPQPLPQPTHTEPPAPTQRIKQHKSIRPAPPAPEVSAPAADAACIGRISLPRPGVREWFTQFFSGIAQHGQALVERRRAQTARKSTPGLDADEATAAGTGFATINASAPGNLDTPVDMPLDSEDDYEDEDDSPIEPARLSGIRAHHTYSIRRESPHGRMHKRPAHGSRLLRNSMIACALALGVLSLQLLPFPWAQQATQVLSQAVNMKVDLDSSLGQLQFVKDIVPESVLVFWNGGTSISKSQIQAPFVGDITHEYSARQPWIEYTGSNQKIKSALTGVVMQLEQSDSGDWAMRIEHDNGLETVYAYLTKPYVSVGDTVERAQDIGEAMGQNGARIYFEVRKNSAAVDPMPYLKIE